MAYPRVRYHKRYQGKFPALLGYWVLLMEKDQARARSRFEVEKMKVLKNIDFQDLKRFFGRTSVPESGKLFCVVEFGLGLPQCQPWAASGAGNIENQDFGVLGHLVATFGPNSTWGAALRAMF